MRTSRLFNFRLWNRMVDEVRRSLPLRMSVEDRGGWAHPWTITPEFDETHGWLFRVHPGFVSGVDPEVSVTRELAPDRTLARLPGAGGPVLARLCERPRIPFPGTRIIGDGAEPEAVSGDGGGGINISYELVPEFFTLRGVFSPTRQTSATLETGLVEVVEERPEDARTLRAFDVWLSVDRFAAKVTWTHEDPSIGDLSTFDVHYSRSAPPSPRARLKTGARFKPLPEPTPFELLTGTFADPEIDEIKIATVFMLSPEGAKPADELTAEWSPFVRYDQFHNLQYEPRAAPSPVRPPEPTRIRTGLAFGIGDDLGAKLLAQPNASLANLTAGLNARSMKGLFYSV